MRKACVVLLMIALALPLFGQQDGSGKVKVVGCVESVNGQFQLITRDGNYVLKGDHNTLFGYTGMLVQVTGKLDAAAKSQPEGVPIVLHVSKLKKVADFCQ